jgi:hypothetical protein
LLGNVAGGFGGNLSVRHPVGCKPLISFGHDESIYKQFLISLKTWTGPGGQKNIAPKDNGLGMMISAFQSREFGLGVVVSKDQLKEVNEKRRNTKYKDLKAAVESRGCKDGFIKPLTSLPVLRTFEYGADSDSYWNYSHMVLQLEDCVDVLQHIYPQYSYLFLFDHSSSHDKQREDGLNVKKMTKSFGGTQRKMRDIIPDKTKTQTLWKEEQKMLLQEKGLPTTGTAKDLIRRAKENGICSKVTSAKVWRDGQEKQRVSYKFYGRGASSMQPALKLTQ